MCKRVTTLFACLAVSLPGLADAQDSPQDPTDLPQSAGRSERNALIFLKAKEETKKVVIHHRPGRLMDLIAMRCASDLTKTIQRLEKRLDTEQTRRLHIFLYRDRRELASCAKLRRHTPQHRHGEYLHTVFDQDLDHAVAEMVLDQWIPPWSTKRLPGNNKAHTAHAFLRGGFALALVKDQIHEVSLRDWAAFYDRVDPLPDMETLLYTGARRRPGDRHLVIAGSWLRYLLDNQPLDKVKRYVATQDCERAFGKTLQELESRWSTWLHGSKIAILDTALMGFDDTVVFHKNVKGIKDRVRLRVAGDDRFYLFHNGAFIRSGHTWFHPTPLFLELTGDDEIEIVVVNLESAGGLLLEMVDSKGTVRVVSDKSWTARRAKTQPVPAKVMGPPLSGRWKAFLSDARKPPIVSMRGTWIWIP